MLDTFEPRAHTHTHAAHAHMRTLTRNSDAHACRRIDARTRTHAKKPMTKRINDYVIHSKGQMHFAVSFFPPAELQTLPIFASTSWGGPVITRN